MEGEDEEFEKLLGEIPQAMESPAQLEGLDSTEKAASTLAEHAPPQPKGEDVLRSHSADAYVPCLHNTDAFVPRSHSADAFHGLFQAFQPVPDFEGCKDKSTRPALSASNAKMNGLMGLDPSHPFQHEEDSHGFAPNQSNSITYTTPANSSLAMAFANLELQAGAPVQCKSMAAGHAEFFGQDSSELSGKPVALYNQAGACVGNTLSSLNITNEVCSSWLAHVNTFQSTASSFSSSLSAQLSLNATNPSVSHSVRGDVNSFLDSRSTRSVTFANADSLVSDVPKSGLYGYAYANSRDLEHGNAGAENFADFLGLGGLDSGIDLMQKRPGNFQGPVVCPRQVEGMAWQHNSEMALYLQAQQLHKIQLLQQVREEEWKHRIELALMHRPQTAGCLQECVDSKYHSAAPSFYAGRDHSFCAPNVGGAYSPVDLRYHLQQQLSNPHADNFYKQGVCSNGNDCSILNSKSKGAARSKAFQGDSTPFDNALSTSLALHDEKPPVRILSRKSSRVAAAPSSSPLMACWLNDNNTCAHRESQGCLHQSADLWSAPLELENVTRPILDPPKDNPYQLTDTMQTGSIYSSLAEIEGRIFAVAKDQNGCRFLQRKFDEGAIEDVQKIFSEVIDHAMELMVDPFGNYLIQKLLEVCTDDQRMDLLKSMTSTGELINVSLNMHGTRAVQKLVETLSSSQQVSIVTASLRSGVVTLIKDLNGNHVIQRCLQHLSNEDNKFIFEAAAYNCVEIATHRHGCCVLQRCIDHSTGGSRQHLIREIALNSLQLSQDSFGNYVVQYVLELGLSWAMEEVMDRLAKNYARLSMQKFSSNVVEKCLKLAGEEGRAQIVQELTDSSHLLQLLQDPYANYVIQSALMVSKGALRTSLVEAIRPHVPSLRSSPYGKRILSRRSLKKF